VTPPTTCTAPAPVEASGPSEVAVDEMLEGWQLLAMAELGRRLTATELAACEQLSVDLALDLLFPRLGDAARHEAMATLG